MGWSCSHVWELQRRIITYWVTQGSCARIWTYQFVSGVTLVETQRYNCRVFCLIFDFHRLWFIPCVNQQHKLNAVIIQHLASFHGGNWRTSMSSSAFVLFVQLTQAPIRPLHCETVAHLLSASLCVSVSLSLSVRVCGRALSLRWCSSGWGSVHWTWFIKTKLSAGHCHLGHCWLNALVLIPKFPMKSGISSEIPWFQYFMPLRYECCSLTILTEKIKSVFRCVPIDLFVAIFCPKYVKYFCTNIDMFTRWFNIQSVWKSPSAAEPKEGKFNAIFLLHVWKGMCCVVCMVWHKNMRISNVLHHASHGVLWCLHSVFPKTQMTKFFCCQCTLITTIRTTKIPWPNSSNTNQLFKSLFPLSFSEQRAINAQLASHFWAMFVVLYHRTQLLLWPLISEMTCSSIPAWYILVALVPLKLWFE